MRVKAKWDGEWYYAKVRAVDDTKKYPVTVTWEDGGATDSLSLEDVRAVKVETEKRARGRPPKVRSEESTELEKGMKVKANWDGKWIKATVVKVGKKQVIVKWADTQENDTVDIADVKV